MQKSSVFISLSKKLKRTSSFSLIRWFDVITSIENYLKYRNEYESCFDELILRNKYNKNNVKKPLEEEIKILELIYNIFKNLKIIFNLLETESNFSICYSINIFENLIIDFKKYFNNSNNEKVKNIIKIFLDQIDLALNNDINNFQNIRNAILNPRTKMWMIEKLKKENTFNLFKSKLLEEEIPNDIIGNKNVVEINNSNLIIDNVCFEIESFEEEIDNYLNQKPNEIDFIKYWKINQYNFPRIYYLSTKYCIINNSLSTIERIWSKARQIELNKGNNLSNTHLELLILLNCNKDHIPKLLI